MLIEDFDKKGAKRLHGLAVVVFVVCGGDGGGYDIQQIGSPLLVVSPLRYKVQGTI